MALSISQKYLNMVFSLIIGNQSKTDEFFAVPNDFRKFEELKVKSASTRTVVVPADATDYDINAHAADCNFLFVIGSHPFVLKRLNYTLFGTNSQFFTSFIAAGRDRPGSFNKNIDPIVTIDNNLDPNGYERVGVGTEDLELIIVTVTIES